MAGLRRPGAAATAALLLLASFACLRTAHAASLCLNMIVKDEIDEIQPGLDAIKEELSGWVICDTGL